MLNETASSTHDRPALRSSVRPMPGEDDIRYGEIRAQVAKVLQITNELFSPPPDALVQDGLLLIEPNSRLLASFEGHLLLDSEAAYDQLDAELKPQNLLPVFRLVDGRHVIHIIEGRVNPKPRATWVNAVLFALTVFSVLEMGTRIALSEIISVNPLVGRLLLNNYFAQLWRGWPYAVSIMLILGSHELGHYFAARRHKLAVTLPYFIPAPFISFLGTFGAFIQLRQPMKNRKVLFDVGAAGPLAGLVFAIPILFIGLSTSPVRPLPPQSTLEGDSIFYAFSKLLVFGEYLPNGRVDVYLNQLAMAGWAGLLVTALNLIPVGQLDGGHILFSLAGRKARMLYYPMVIASVLLAIQSQAWILWVLLLLLFGRTYAAPLDMITPMDNRRRALAIFSLVLFVLLFVPVPIREVNNGGGIPFRDTAMTIPVLTAGIVVLYQRVRERFS